MRPAGEIRQALMTAAGELATPDRGATLRELAARAQVGHAAARSTIQNMHRAGHLVRREDRRVAYRNRPVAQYAPASQSQPVSGVADILRVWQV
jgi:hypothetical protein